MALSPKLSALVGSVFLHCFHCGCRYADGGLVWISFAERRAWYHCDKCNRTYRVEGRRMRSIWREYEWEYPTLRPTKPKSLNTRVTTKPAKVKFN